MSHSDQTASPLPPPLRLLDGNPDDGAVTLDKIGPAGDPQPGDVAIGDQMGGFAQDRGMPQRHGADLEQESQMPISPPDHGLAPGAVLLCAQHGCSRNQG